MATFLTNSKMDPALRARVDASVRGHRGHARSDRRSRRLVSSARLVLILAVVYSVAAGVTGLRNNRRELEALRASLLHTVAQESASLTAEDQLAITRDGTWIAHLSAEYEGDFVDDSLRSPGALVTLLARSTVYLRSAIDAATLATDLTTRAHESTKDPLLLCLLEPPASRGEAVLMEKVRASYTGDTALESRTANARRLHDLVAGLPFLLPPWSERVRRANDRTELLRLRTELDHAPIDRAKAAAKADLLLVALDEPGDEKGPTELDGERPHPVRVALVNLGTGKVLLRARRSVDPSWITKARRPNYAAGLDGCALAYDIHEGVRRTDQETSGRN